jgi:D-glycero-alpha-D-manno-heptose-7-phosphate kinase
MVLKNNSFDLAVEAADIEINQLNEPIGYQDQFGCAIGGIKKITFNPDKSVLVEPITLRSNQMEELNNNLILFQVGQPRSASKILKTQSDKTKADEETFNRLLKIRDLAEELSIEIHTDIDSVGHYLNSNWQEKRQLTKDISTNEIDEIYQTAIKNGAIGGKLLGAGQSGFILFYCKRKNQEKLSKKLSKLKCFPVKVDDLGVTSKSKFR